MSRPPFLLTFFFFRDFALLPVFRSGRRVLYNGRTAIGLGTPGKPRGSSARGDVAAAEAAGAAISAEAAAATPTTAG